ARARECTRPAGWPSPPTGRAWPTSCSRCRGAPRSSTRRILPRSSSRPTSFPARGSWRPGRVPARSRSRSYVRRECRDGCSPTSSDPSSTSGRCTTWRRSSARCPRRWSSGAATFARRGPPARGSIAWSSTCRSHGRSSRPLSGSSSRGGSSAPICPPPRRSRRSCSPCTPTGSSSPRPSRRSAGRGTSPSEASAPITGWSGTRASSRSPGAARPSAEGSGPVLDRAILRASAHRTAEVVARHRTSFGSDRPPTPERAYHRDEGNLSRAPGRGRGPAYTCAYAGGDVMPGPDPREQQERYEKQIHELQTQVRFLEDEVALLRRRLTNAPRQVKILEDKLLETKADLSRALAQNEKLAATLKSERDKIEALREEVEKLSQPPASFGVYLSTNRDGSVDVFTSGRKMRVNVAPELDPSRFRRGAEVILNEALNVVEVLDPDRSGEVMKVKDRLGEDRVIVFGHGDEELV